jgi:hypothetical protein
VVVRDQGSHDRLASGVVVPDGGGQGQEALQDADGHPAWVVAAVAFEIELALEGVVDRLDDLAQRLKNRVPAWLGLALAGRAQRAQPGRRQDGLGGETWRAGPRARQPWRRSGRRPRAGRAGCRPGAAATPRSTADGKRSTRTRPTTRPGQSALRCRGSGRTPPGWNPPPRRLRSTAWCRRPGRGCSAGSAPRRHAAAFCTRAAAAGTGTGAASGRARTAPPGHVSRYHLILDTLIPSPPAPVGIGRLDE